MIGCALFCLGVFRVCGVFCLWRVVCGLAMVVPLCWSRCGPAVVGPAEAGPAVAGPALVPLWLVPLLCLCAIRFVCAQFALQFAVQFVVYV